MIIKIISAVSLDGIIGIENSLPWQGKYKEDLKFFREKTNNSTVIMGRKTYESLGKPLPNRRNIVVSKLRKSLSSTTLYSKDIEVVSSLNDAITLGNTDVWLIGGSSIYASGLNIADEIYLTIIPEIVDNYSDNRTVLKTIARFPWINPNIFVHKHYKNLAKDLDVIRYTKI